MTRQFAAMVMLCAGIAATASGLQGSPLDREARDIYLPRGDVISNVIELIAQLQVSAGIDLGGSGESPLSDQLDFITGSRIRAHRLSQAFEMRSGTVRECIQAYLDHVGQYEWSLRDEVLRIGPRNASPNHELLAMIVAPHARPVGDAVVPWYVVVDSVRELRGGGRSPFSGMTVESSYDNGLLLAREEMLNVAPDIDQERFSLGDYLDAVAKSQDNRIWLAIKYETPRDAGGRTRQEIIISNWSATRRKLTPAELVLCLNDTYKPLHGYRDMDVRVDDARREVRRRHHFQPAMIRGALAKGQVLEKALANEDAWKGASNVRWLLSLDDEVLTGVVLKALTGVPDADRRRHLVDGGVPRNPNWTPQPDAIKAFWKQLADTDPDPVIRKIAGDNLAAWDNLSTP